MIIGVNGKIGNGKDTVGRIIQVLTSKYGHGDDVYGFEEWQNIKTYTHSDIIFEEGEIGGTANIPSNFKIKKFADKLKDIVCLLIGCTREQLEDREFKEKELGEEWIQYFDSDYELLQKESILSMFSERLTPRKLLQLLGTECGRNIIHPNIWVNALMSKYNCVHCRQNPCSVRHKNLIGMKPNYPNWVITDLRFKNELEAVKDRGGITIRIDRNITRQTAIQLAKDKFGKDWKDGYLNEELIEDMKSFIEKDEHESETALDNAKFNYVIENNGTIEELIEKVREILIKEGII